MPMKIGNDTATTTEPTLESLGITPKQAIDYAAQRFGVAPELIEEAASALPDMGNTAQQIMQAAYNLSKGRVKVVKPDNKAAEAAPFDNRVTAEAYKAGAITKPERTWGQAAKDMGLGVAQGMIGANEAVIGAANTLLGFEDAVEANKRRNDVSGALDSVKSAGLLVQNQKAEDDSKYLSGRYQSVGVPAEIADALATTGAILNNPAKLSDVAAQGVGSIAVSLPLTATTGALGASAIMGGGAAANEAVDRIVKDDAAMAQLSDVYQQAFMETGSQDKALEVTARKVQLPALVVGGALSALATKVTGGGKVEQDLLAGKMTAAKIPVSMLREGGEEALQSPSEQVGANVAIMDNIDRNQTYMEGTGKAFGEGLIGGMAAGGAMGAAGAASSRATQAKTKLADEITKLKVQRDEKLAKAQAAAALPAVGQASAGVDQMLGIQTANQLAQADSQLQGMMQDLGMIEQIERAQVMPQDPELKALAAQGVPVVEVTPSQPQPYPIQQVLDRAIDTQKQVEIEAAYRKRDAKLERQKELDYVEAQLQALDEEHKKLRLLQSTTPVSNNALRDKLSSAIKEVEVKQAAQEAIRQEIMATGNPRLVEAGIEEMQGVEVPELPMAITPELAESYAPKLPENFNDERLLDEAYRVVLGEVFDNTTKGGGVSLAPVAGTGYTGGDGNEYGQQMTRTKSINYPITQALISDGYTAEEVKAALDASLKGQKLGKRWQGLVAKALDYSNSDATDIRASMAEFEQAKAAEIEPDTLGYGDTVNAPFAPDNAQPVTLNDQAQPRGADDAVKYSFAGRNAKTANLDNLANAEARIAAGEDAEVVRQETGWHQGVDGKWRFEIDDSGAEVLPVIDTGVTHRLSDVLKHDALFEAYPALQNMFVSKGKKTYITGNHIRIADVSNYAKDIQAQEDAIYREAELLQEQGKLTSEKEAEFEQLLNELDKSSRTDQIVFDKSSLMHEIQHAIQEEENFARGGNSQDAFADPRMRAGVDKNATAKAYELLAEKLAELQQALTLEQFAQQAWQSNEITDEIRDSYADYLQTITKAKGDKNLERHAQEWAAKEWYRRLAGEVEARNTQKRLGMNAQERKLTAPSATQDVPNDKQIVRFEGGRAEMAISEQDGFIYIDGSKDIGYLDLNGYRESAPIRLEVGDKGYGLTHIELRHGAEIRNAGFESVEHFIKYVADNYTEVRKAKDGKLMLDVVDGRSGKAMLVQLQPEGDGSYWGISTAGIFNKRYINSFDKVVEVDRTSQQQVWDDTARFRTASSLQVPSLGEGASVTTSKNTTTTNLTKQQATDIISQDADGKRLLKNGKVKVLGSIDEAPDNVQNQITLSDADGNIQGFFDPATDTTYLVADALTADTINGVLVHEVGVHAWWAKANSDKKAALEKRAMQLLNQGNYGNEKIKAFYAAVEQRMIDADVQGNAEEAAAYIVEEAINQASYALSDMEANPNDKAQVAAAIKDSKANMFKLSDSRLIDWVAKNISQSLANFLSDFISSVRASMHRIGWLKTANLTGADLVAIAKRNMREVATSKGVENTQGNVSDYAGVLASMASDKPTQAEIAQAQRDLDTQLAIADKVIADNGYLTAPNGEKSNLNKQQWAQVRTPQFKAWFGDWENDVANASKVVDANGEPLVVYHGTGADFDSFDKGRIGENYRESEDGGFFFTISKRSASNYAELADGENTNVIPAYIKLERPYEFSANSDYLSPADYYDMHNISIIELVNNNLDGVFISGTKKDDLVVAFNPNQIKSAIGNVGTFSGKTGNINFSKRGKGKDIYGFMDNIQKGLDQVTDMDNNGADSSALYRQIKANFVGQLSKTGVSKAWLNQNTDAVLGDMQNAEGAWLNYGELAALVDNAPMQATGTDVVDATTNSTPSSKQPANNLIAPRETFKDRLIVDYVDDINRVKQLQDMVNEKVGADSSQVYDAAMRYRAITPSRLLDMQRSVERIIQGAAKDGVTSDVLGLYMYAVHAPERNAYLFERDGVENGSGMTDDAAKNIVDQLEQEYAGIDKHAQAFRGLLDAVMTMRVINGTVSQAQADEWKAKMPNYVPLKNSIEDGAEFEANTGITQLQGFAGMGTGTKFNLTGKEIKRANGRVSQAGHILENAMFDMQKGIVRAEKNNVLVEFARTVARHRDALFEGRALWDVYGKKPDDMTNVVEYMVDGRKGYIRINDQSMYEAFAEMDGDAFTWVDSAVQFIKKTITAWNPAFTVVNAARDTQTALLNGSQELGVKGAAKMAAYVPSAMAASWRYERGSNNEARSEWDKWHERYRLAGGKTGFLDVRPIEKIQRDINNLFRINNKAVTWKDYALKTGNAMGQVVKVVEDMGGATENMWRLAAFRVAVEQGKSVKEAARIAKNLTVNFDRRGKNRQTLEKVFLFYNAAIQGTVRMKQSMAAKGALAIVGGLMAAGFLAAGQDWEDEEGNNLFDLLPEHEKMRGIPITIADDGKRIVIPMAYGFGYFVYMGMKLRQMQRYVETDGMQGVSIEKGLSDLFNGVALHFNPFGGQQFAEAIKGENDQLIGLLTPVITDPFVQIATNKNAFGGSLYPENAYNPNDRPDSEKAFEHQKSSIYYDIARTLSRATGGDGVKDGFIEVAPATLEALVRAFTGGAGQFVEKTLTLATRAASDEMDMVEPANVPVGSVVYKKGQDKLYYDAYQELVKDVQKAANDLKRYNKGDSDTGDVPMEVEAKWQLRLTDDAKQAKKALDEIRDEEKALNKEYRGADDKDTRAALRAEIERLKAQKVQIQSEFVRRGKEERAAGDN